MMNKNKAIYCFSVLYPANEVGLAVVISWKFKANSGYGIAMLCFSTERTDIPTGNSRNDLDLLIAPGINSTHPSQIKESPTYYLK